MIFFLKILDQIYDVTRTEIFKETYFCLLHYDANLSRTNIMSSAPLDTKNEVSYFNFCLATFFVTSF